MNTRWQKVNRGLLLLVFFFLVIKAGPARSAGVWGSRPLLSYFALTPSLETQLRQDVPLSQAEHNQVEQIAWRETERLRQNYENSKGFVDNPSLTIAEKRRRVEAMGYNRRVDEILYLSDRELKQTLSASSYHRLVSWIERRWLLEAARHGRPYARSVYSKPATVRSYEIYATRFGSKGGAYVVALPDQCLKFANGGLHTCDSKGYTAGSGYSVAISYKQGIGVLVGDAGPWNIDDNFWATAADPQPRRMFVDLALGMPEAQAAYFNGYNGGKDQYGRKVTAPFAIDLAFKVGDDIGLPSKKNDWVTVSFLWTGDWGGKKSNTGKQTGVTPGVQPEATLASIPMIATAAPAPDGSITHIVKAGETLWAVAVAYHVRTAEIQHLNNMGQTVIIYEGQKLKIKEAGPTWTALPGAEQTAQPTISTSVAETRTVRASEVPTFSPAGQTATQPVEVEATRQPDQTPTPMATTAASPALTTSPLASASGKSPLKLDEKTLILASLVVVGAGLVLFVLGSLLGKEGNGDDEA